MPVKPKDSLLNNWGRVKPRLQRLPKAKPLPLGTEIARDDATGTRIAYNPPASAMDPYVTPLAFIPLRLRAAMGHPTSTAAASSTQTEDLSSLPPALNPRRERPMLTEDQIESIRRRRAEGESKNQLAREYGCSTLFVSLVAPAPKGAKEAMLRAHEEIRQGWGEKKRLVRAAQKTQRDSWGYGP